MTRKNFAAVVLELGAHLEACDYVVMTTQKIGTPTGWRRVLSICNKKLSIPLRAASSSFWIRPWSRWDRREGFGAKRLFFLPTSIFFFYFDDAAM
jgi:hypothetical protein